MNKIKLVIKREYLTRVRKKSFLIMTFLSPIFFGFLIIIPTLIALAGDSDEKLIAVIDATGVYDQKFKNSESIKFEFLPIELENELKENFHITEYYAYMTINEKLSDNINGFKLVSNSQITIDVREYVQSEMHRVWVDEKLQSYGIEELDKIMREISSSSINISTAKIDDEGFEKETAAEISMALSMLFAFLSYFVVFMYGSQVMRGVAEEKSNRIVEVIISSIKPFELMMGKIVGIALVALTQFALWIILTVGVVSVVKNVIPDNSDFLAKQEIVVNNSDLDGEVDVATNFDINSIISELKAQNIGMMVLLFVIYFIGGYLIYASLFAAVGSAVDAETDSQQFVLPITIPVIIGLYIAMFAFKSPHSSLVFWSSIFPLTSPVVMLARLPFDVPAWEIIVSLVVLVGSFIFSTWFAGRIYRTGILMYGKKVTYKELWKWFKYSGK